MNVCVFLWASPVDPPRLGLIGRYGNKTPQWWSSLRAAVSMTTAGSMFMCVRESDLCRIQSQVGGGLGLVAY